MDRSDQSAIEDLFRKLATVERQSPQRDAGAEAFIRERIAAQPGAPYYMAQTIVVQEQALRAAQARIEDLEAQAGAAAGEGRPFGRLFGESRPKPRGGSVPSFGRPAGEAQHRPPAPVQRGGGGFLAGAAQTAMGVAGGMLLANVIGGMLGGGAQAAEADAGADEMAADEAGAEETGFDNGGDLGDMEF